MAEYIKQKIQGGKKSICDSCTHRNVCKAIDNQPCTECNHYQCTDDVAPVRHGRWIDSGDYVTTAYGSLPVKMCSECHMDVTLEDFDNYCPNCGAKMDGGDGNDDPE